MRALKRFEVAPKRFEHTLVRLPVGVSDIAFAAAPGPVTPRPLELHGSRAQAGDRLDHGAVQPGRRARAGQRKHAAQLARQRTLTPALRRQPVAQFQGNVSGGRPGPGQRERLRPQQARVIVGPR